MKRLIVDMDDVLADASADILRIFNELNNTALEHDFFKENSFYEYVNKPGFKSYRSRIEAVGFFANLQVFPDAIEVMQKLNEKYALFVVSAATEFPNSLKEKYDWMQRYFPFITWQRFVLCGDKSIIKGDIMIDDHEKNLKTFDGQKILFDAMHNQHVKAYNRVHNWQEVATQLL